MVFRFESRTWKGITLDTFNALPPEKRERIINSALSAFGDNGYKKTSVADVANASGFLRR